MDDELRVGKFAMQGDDVVLLGDVIDGTRFAVRYCQGWKESTGIRIPVAGGCSFWWSLQQDTILPETGRKSSDDGAGEREQLHAFRWGIRQITDPLLRIRAAYTERELEVFAMKQRIMGLEREMAGLRAAFEIAVPKA